MRKRKQPLWGALALVEPLLQRVHHLDHSITVASFARTPASQLPQHTITTTAQIHNILCELKKPTNMGKPLHSEIQQRWEAFLKEGVDKDEITSNQLI